MTRKVTTDTLANDIEYIKNDIKIINEKLDKKYVSHETFDLTVSSMNKAVQTIIYVGLFLLTPIYGAVIALLFKIFTQ
jgi:hypothetical protein